MAVNAFEQITEVATAPEFRETGGSHNTQGIEFQKHWAVLRMFELTEQGEVDFLFLFEAIQDVAVLDSKESPSAISVYQVKKRSRTEWSWTLLTGIHDPNAKTKKELDEIKKSPLGKLYSVVRKLSMLSSSGAFVSNLGCNLPLAPEGSFATSMSEPLGSLGSDHHSLLVEALSRYHDAGEELPDLSRLRIERVNLSPEEPGSTLVGKVHDFLAKRSAAHAGQARALVDALLIKVTALSLRTPACKDFEELCQKCGFSKLEFDAALGALQHIPDDYEGFKKCVAALEREGLSIFTSYHLDVAGSKIFRRRLMGAMTPEESSLIIDCDTWVKANPPPQSGLMGYLENGVAALTKQSMTLSRHDVIAQILFSSLNHARP